MLRQGAVLWIPSDQWNQEHMNVVLSRPEKDSQSIVLVPWTSRDGWVDETCLIRKGEHERVSHDTCVDYQRARLATEAELLDAIAAGTIREAAPTSESLLARILKGATQRANYMPNECEEILLGQGLIE